PTPPRLAEEPGDVVRPDRPLEPVQKEQAWSVGRRARRVEAMQVDEIAVRSVPSFHAQRERGASAKKLGPERLRMPARYPPRGPVGILAAAVARHVRRSRSEAGDARGMHGTR